VGSRPFTNLIERARRLLPVDPSSACQRLFNAAVRDVRDKILIVGVGIAREAAKMVDQSDGWRAALATTEWSAASRCTLVTGGEPVE
jgi:hypothetical protein